MRPYPDSAKPAFWVARLGKSLSSAIDALNALFSHRLANLQGRLRFTQPMDGAQSAPYVTALPFLPSHLI